MNLDPRLVWGIVGLVGIVWGTLMIMHAVNPEVEVPAQLSGLFMAVAGAAVTQLGVGKAKTDDTKDKETKP